ncbi:MAG TPA: MFS transporter [Candidatus Hydrogenedentes bacterium]|nr:MFS transporter [Candidatus Hydrogenedentota bacterium]
MSKQSEETVQTAPSFQGDQQQVIWLVWLTYGAFYFCRTNISVAVPGMGTSVEEGGLGLSGEQIGLILASLKLAYGFGQLVNGQLAERISPRKLLAVGMLGSATLNILFGFSTGFYFLLFIWACNGYCQALGWTPCMRVTSNWIPVSLRGKAIGIIGTGYQITLGMTFFVAGQSAEWLGWRAAFYVPSAMLVSAAIVMLLFLRESPDASTEADSNEDDADLPPKIKSSIKENLFLTLSNPLLWLLGISLGLLNASRYGFIDWGITHLIEVQGTGVGKASLKFIVLPLGAVAGSFVSGWATDRFFGSRRAPVACILLVTLGVLTLLYEYLSRVNVPATIILLGLIGFCIYGPQVLLVGTAPSDLARRGTAAAAAGFVNFIGYMGAATGDIVTGHYRNPEHGGWEVAIYIWAGWAFMSAFFVALLWNARGKSTT